MKMFLYNHNSLKTFAIASLFFITAGSALGQTNVVPDDQEFQALKALYDSLGGATWTNKTNWPTSGNWPATATAAQMATWFGVTVTNGDVSGISLINDNLTGKIPMTISQLSKLQSLDFNTNRISGKIPSSIGSLTQLTWLRLDSNQFTGQIPNEIGNLTNLIWLYLSTNKLTGSIPSSMCNLTSLKYFILSNNQLSGEIPTCVQNLVNIDLFWVGGNLLTGSFPNVTNLPKITSLILVGNKLTGGIPSSIGNMSTLREFYVEGNNFGGQLPASIGNLKSLSYLNVNSCNLTGQIPPEIGKATNLSTIYLGYNQLSGSIPNDIGNLTKLTTFYLCYNQLSGSIPSSIGNLVNLYDFEFQSNNLSGSIPSSLGNLTKVRYLYLFNNKLSGTLPASLGNLVSAAYVRFENNQLTGPLPDFSRLPLLAQLIVNNNQLSGPILASNFATGMMDFQISGNQFSGTFPNISTWSWIGNLVIGPNQFSGDFPSVAGLTKLNYIYATGNKFTSIPTSVINLVKGGNIYFDNNLISTIPNLASDIANNNIHPSTTLNLRLANNKLDFSQLESLMNLGIPLTYNPQKTISDVLTQAVTIGTDFILTARPKGNYTSSLKWEKLQPNSTWQDISSSNADPLTGNTYRIASATASAEGSYRWSCTSTRATGFTLMSDPIVVKTPQRFTMDNFGFQYKYDGRRRMIQKKVPGADWVYMVYDNRDRLVLTQDGNQRLSNQWTFTKYDALNRPVSTGIYSPGSFIDQATMQTNVNNYYTNLTSSQAWYESFSTATGNVHNYDNKSFPQVADPSVYLTVTYFDNYSFLNGDSQYAYVPNDAPSQTVNGVTYSQPANYFNRVTGKTTGTKVKVLGTDVYWLKNVNYYDDKYRLVQTVSDNQRVGQQRTTNLYDFAGKVLSTKTTDANRRPTWTNLVNVSVTGGSIISTASYWVAGAASTEQLSAGQDGWVETTVSNLSGKLESGLSDVDVNVSYTTINYGWFIQGTSVFPFENGVQKTGAFTVSQGDVVRVERNATTVKYKINGTVVYTSATPSTTVLIADVSLYAVGNSLLNVRTSFSTGTQTIARSFDYDHAGRLLKTWHSVNGATPVLLSKNEYNEIGQLVDKKLHSTDNGSKFKQSIDHRYNIRGWLTSINNSQVSNDGGTTNDESNDLFGMNLSYNDVVSGMNNAPQFNGNISAMRWSNNLALGTIKDVGYNYTYDTLNRIKSATYLTNSGTWAASNNFAEKGFSYDLNGNIKKLTRTNASGIVMDQLKYDYSGQGGASNQLKSVTDSGDLLSGFTDGNVGSDDYVYDANGNMTADKNKNITAIAYNYLNLPQQVTKGTGEKIVYAYDAGGRKLKQQVYSASGALKTTDYVGEWIYENDALQLVNHEEGRVIPDGTWNNSPQLLPNSDGSSTNGFNTASPASVTTQTIGTETYLKVVSNVNGGRPGVWTNWITVQPGQQYQLRLKGYRTASQVSLYVTGSKGDLVWPGTPLPAGAGSEDWVNTVFTVPADVSSIQVGALWTGGLINDMFYINNIELYSYDAVHGSQTFVPNGNNVYQYHLKDHLGNVRLTFTTKNDVEANTATFEPANQNVEQSKFVRYDDARLINSTLFDHTHNGTTAYSERLSGSANEKTGIARSISVMPGDTIKMEVFAKYVDGSNSNNTAALTQLLSQIVTGTASAGTVIDGAAYSTNGITPFPFTGLAGEGNSTGLGPKAYMNYIMFDRNYNPILGDASQTNFVRMSTAGKEDGRHLPYGNKFDSLAAQVVVKQPGYMYIWLSNEETSPVEVYFDDFKVTQNNSPVVQQEDFYPFGLTFNSYTRESSVPQNFLYNGKELQTDLGLNWEDYGARMYMPELGRWGAIDPMSERLRKWSPYSYAFDNPIAFIDIDGNIPWPKVFGKGRTAKKGSRGFGMHEHPVSHKIKMHDGLDLSRYTDGSGNEIPTSTGTSIYPLARGIAHLKEDNVHGGGKYVSVVHADGYETRYMHISAYKVKEGQEVDEKTIIAEVGNTGISTGPHLHLGMFKNGVAIDPEDIEDLQILLYGNETDKDEDNSDGVLEWIKGVKVFETAYWLFSGRERDVPKRLTGGGSGGGGFDFMNWFSGSSSSSGDSGGSTKKQKKKPDADREASKRSGGG